MTLVMDGDFRATENQHNRAEQSSVSMHLNVSKSVCTRVDSNAGRQGRTTMPDYLLAQSAPGDSRSDEAESLFQSLAPPDYQIAHMAKPPTAETRVQQSIGARATVSFAESMLRGFEVIDTDNDGHVTKTEVKEAFENPDLTGTDAAVAAVFKGSFARIAGYDSAMAPVYRVVSEITGTPFPSLLRDFNESISKADVEHVCDQYDEVMNRVAVAHGMEHLGETVIKKLDRNNDGALTSKELNEKPQGMRLSFDEEVVRGDMMKRFEDIVGRGNIVSVARLKDFVVKLRTDIDPDRALARNADEKTLPARHGKISTQLYARGEDPLLSINPRAIRQGSIGDCYFLAAVGTTAAMKPQVIRDMIKDNQDGTYTVTFPAAPDEPITVNAPTQQELALYARHNDYGIWPAVLEKAYGQYLYNSVWRRRLPTELIPYDQLQENAGTGSASHAGLRVMTGSKARSNIFGMWTSMDDLDKQLSNAFAQDVPVTAYRRNLSGYDPGIPNGHEYSIIGYNSNRRTITIRNPWGETEPTNEWGSAADGTDDGVYSMHLNEFYRRFSGIGYATKALP